jgi:hypothetical protein
MARATAAMLCAALALASACSAPQSSGSNTSAKPGGDDVMLDAGTDPEVDAAMPAEDAATDAGSPLAEFPYTIEVTRHDFGILGPTDLIGRSDGRAYVLLASARGVRTGRPMAIVNLENGDIEQTSAAPIPLSKPYGIAFSNDDLFVVNESRTTEQPDLVYVDALFYDASADLWHVVPLPEGELMQSVTYDMTRDGLVVGLYDESENKLYRFDPENRTFTRIESIGPEGCMASRAYDGDTVWVVGLRVDNGSPTGCAAKFEGETELELPAPPSPRCIHTVARAGGKTWLVGGYESCGTTMFPATDIVDVLPDGADAWRRLPPLPIRVFPSGNATIGDDLLIFDGTLGVMVWVPDEEAWAHAKPVDDMQNNSDWIQLGDDRVATLAWKGDRKDRGDQVVVFTFRQLPKRYSPGQ